MNSKLCAVLFSVALIQIPIANGQTLSVLHNFSGGSDGSNPISLLLSSNKLYGTSGAGSDNGALFSLDTKDLSYQVLYAFQGSSPIGRMAIVGTTLYYGSTLLDGTAFAFDISQTNITTLHSFDGPLNGLVQAEGTLYGTAPGGSNGDGGIFSMDIHGSNFTYIHNFKQTEGIQPYKSPIVTNDMIFGQADFDGPNSASGTIYSMNTNGSNFTVLHSFAPGSVNDSGFYINADGFAAAGSLLLVGNRLFGATVNGGSNGTGTIFALDITGSNFIVLHTFSSYGTAMTNSDGADPMSDLVLFGNTLYGATSRGGANGNGVVFSTDFKGSNFYILHSFSSNSALTNSDGANPSGQWGLSGNTLFGTTSSGGAYGLGTVYSLQLPVVVISNITRNISGSTTITFVGSPNSTYLVQATTNLITPAIWTTLSTNTAGTNGLWQFTDTDASNAFRFYRSSTL